MGGVVLNQPENDRVSAMCTEMPSPRLLPFPKLSLAPLNISEFPEWAPNCLKTQVPAQIAECWEQCRPQSERTQGKPTVPSPPMAWWFSVWADTKSNVKSHIQVRLSDHREVKGKRGLLLLLKKCEHWQLPRMIL